MFAVILNCMLRKQHLVLFSLFFNMKKSTRINCKNHSTKWKKNKKYMKKNFKIS